MEALKQVESQLTGKSERILQEYRQRWDAVAKGQRHYRDELEDFALFLHGNDFYDGAIVAYSALIQEDPQNAVWPFLYSNILQDYGMTDKALEMLDRSIGLDPGHALSYLKKADLLAKMGQQEKAAQAYNRALTVDPTLAHASLGLARMAIDDKNWEQAQRQLLEAVKQDASLSSSHFLLATVYEQLGDAKLAEKHRMIGTELGRFREPVDPWAERVYEHCFDAYKLSVLADTLGKTRRLDQALVYFEKARALDPEDGSLCFTTAQTYLKHGDREMGMKLLDESIRLDPLNSNAYIAKAAEFAVDGQNQAALNVIDTGIKTAGATAFLYRQRGLLLGAMGDEVGMELMFLKAVKVEPDNVKCNVTLANHLWSNGNQASAIYYYEQARKLSMLETKSRAVLASYYLERGEIEAAADYLKEIGDVEPEFEGLREMKAVWFLKKGNLAFQIDEWKEAERCYREAWFLNPDAEKVINNWMTLLVKTGRTSEALQQLNSWIDQSKTPKIFYYRLAATICLQEGMKERAKHWLQEGKTQAKTIGDREAVLQFSQQLKRLETAAGL